ncbi:MAG: L-serine ammonia-lyase, iron-sulfur-dependent subunit beta [Bacillota bacterium]
MSNISVFEILGPVMIGPSSSHTAGAEKLGKAARSIGGSDFDEVEFHLHGSFAHTYKGHGTDKALAAGILGMEADDERLKDSIEIAEKKGIKVVFLEADLGEVHPNTVKIVLKKEGNTTLSLTGSSIGGGNVILTQLDEDKVEISGKLYSCIIKHRDIRGMISKITAVLALNQINIATLKVGRESKGDVATTVIETDNQVMPDVVKEISKIENIISIRTVNMLDRAANAAE